MASGLPVVAANRGAVPEVAQDAATLIDDPYDHRGFAQAIRSILEDPEINALHVKKGLERAADFSWDRTAALTREVLMKAARG